eukprot:TRINITY_DN1543_c0_g2_i1.p2 TRINITY_DN1543_c0_g2~~TRINITY_DN1543_c0_g2_i1.p2  ORF type:complete len:258 (-),score=47.70 TRINITY_DN1543_c0_g2_i1:1254-2027(-)
MASGLMTQVSRDGTAATAPQQEQPKPKKKGMMSSLFCCFFDDPVKTRQEAEHGGHEAHEFQQHDVAENYTEALLPPVKPPYDRRKCLVLDLDETLVHSSFKPVDCADFIVPVEIEDQVHQVYVLKRPGVDEFMKRMGELYEVVVFTASLSKYADPVLDLLDIHKVVEHRLFREACVNHKGNYVKDMGLIGRPLKWSIIIDNSPASYMFNPENAIPIESWFDDENDTELLDIIPFLEELCKVDNVMDTLRSNNSIMYR